MLNFWGLQGSGKFAYLSLNGRSHQKSFWRNGLGFKGYSCSEQRGD